jgi:hypothetical protein
LKDDTKVDIAKYIALTDSVLLSLENYSIEAANTAQREVLDAFLLPLSKKY